MVEEDLRLQLEYIQDYCIDIIKKIFFALKNLIKSDLMRLA